LRGGGRPRLRGQMPKGRRGLWYWGNSYAVTKNNGNNVAVAPNVFLDAEGIIHEKRHHNMGQLLSYCHNFFEQSSHQLVPQIFNNADTQSPS
ncbi:MAG: hypothetical protein U0L77_07180, partial [Prevotellamassilia sp.]|nr:hypothetical protein [Prevotellamassilia sp.]